MQSLQKENESKIARLTALILSIYALFNIANMLSYIARYNPVAALRIAEMFSSAHIRYRSGSVIGGLVLFATALIMVIIVAIVIYLFVNAATSTAGLTSNQKGNLTNFVNTGQSGLSLASIVPVIVIAAVIISVVGGFLVYRGR